MCDDVAGEAGVLRGIDMVEAMAEDSDSREAELESGSVCGGVDTISQPTHHQYIESSELFDKAAGNHFAVLRSTTRADDADDVKIVEVAVALLEKDGRGVGAIGAVEAMGIVRVGGGEEADAIAVEKSQLLSSTRERGALFDGLYQVGAITEDSEELGVGKRENSLGIGKEVEEMMSAGTADTRDEGKG